jgi:APA family basic amino acid/polyamine antiporter
LNIIRDMFRKKPLPTTSDTGHGLRRHLSAWDLAGIGIGCMVGVGIFVLPGVEAAGHAGPAMSVECHRAANALRVSELADHELSSFMAV